MKNVLFRQLVFIFMVLLLSETQAVTLDELENTKGLNPKTFAQKFSTFKYQYFPQIQDPELFLFSESGDCDDFATLADRVLKKAGYTTRLISIKMPGLPSHVVCYVEEEKGYLDFNNRADLFPIKKCGAGLPEIASKVAKSFSAHWTSVTQFAYEGNNIKRPLQTLAKTDTLKASRKTDNSP